MKVCPKCGFQDDPAWRNRHFDPHAEIMTWDDFTLKYPELSAKLIDTKFVVLEDQKLVYGRQPYPPKAPRFAVRLTIQEFESRGKSLRLQMEHRNRTVISYSQKPIGPNERLL
jgi:hypothetical protein